MGAIATYFSTVDILYVSTMPEEKVAVPSLLHVACIVPRRSGWVNSIPPAFRLGRLITKPPIFSLSACGEFPSTPLSNRRRQDLLYFLGSSIELMQYPLMLDANEATLSVNVRSIGPRPRSLK
ncbi:MAG: hypothetical protein Q9212_005161 [Teloschistes hypoglaucus]